MKHTLYLVRRYLQANPGKSAVLVGSLCLLLYLPAGLQVLVDRTAVQLRARADSTPLLLGAKGSSLDLALRALYFEGEVPASLEYRQVTRVRDSGLADPIPLHVRFRVGEHPVVGTTLDYFRFRGLRIDSGRPFAMLGECVVGADVEAVVGGKVTTAPENLFDFAGSYPLRMQVAGVLARTHGPDDRAVFVDIKTAWVIEGLGHGHRDLAEPGAQGDLLNRDGNTFTANPKLTTFQEITSDNVGSFHFHGELATHPITAVLALPPSEKSKALLLGRYLGRDEPCQILEPRAVMDDLIATVVRVRGYVLAVSLLLGIATLGTVILVFTLSIRLRRGEVETMRKIGCSRRFVGGLLAGEALVVFLVALGVAGLLTLLTATFAESLIRAVIV
ncbi:MAG: ABC transporter permease [Planctomycetota bacterium]